jgi:hypothetical protein
MAEVAYFKQVIDPENVLVSPPYVNNNATTIQAFTAFVTFNASSAVPSLVLIWNPILGVTACHMYVEVPASTPLPSGGSSILSAGLSFLAAIILPISSAYDVRVEPPVTTNFTVGRQIAGMVFIRSDSTSTTSAALSGSITGGVLSDTRNANGYSVSSISSQTVNKKDLVFNGKISDGVVCIQGPDTPLLLGEVNWDTTNRFGNRLYATIDKFISPISVGAASGYAHAAFSPYITGANWIYPIPPIGLQEAPVFKAYVTNTTTVQSYITFTHVFVQYNYGTLAVNTTLVSESFIIGAQKDVSNVPADGTYPSPMQYEFASGATPIPNWMWVMTDIAITLPSNGGGGTAVSVLTNVQYTVPQTAQNLGPARVVRLDNVANNQQIIISGKFFIEACPGRDVAPYLSSTQQVAVHVDVMPTLKRLFDSPSATMFRRIYAKSYYDFVTRDQLPAIKTYNDIVTLSDEVGIDDVQGTRKRQRYYPIS